MARAELMDRLRGLLGGRAAEEVVLGEVSTGAENDLQQATALARRAVCQWGMGESVVLMHCAQPRPVFLAGDAPGSIQRDCSEAAAHAVDEEVQALLGRAYEDARALLLRNRAELEGIAQELLRRETLDEAEFRALLGEPAKGASSAKERPLESAPGRTTCYRFATDPHPGTTGSPWPTSPQPAPSSTPRSRRSSPTTSW